MKPKDRISKASFSLVESSKDVLKANLVKAIQSEQLHVEAKDVTLLLSIVSMSVDEGFHKGHRTFMKTVEKALDDECKSVVGPTLSPKVSEKKASKAS